MPGESFDVDIILSVSDPSTPFHAIHRQKPRGKDAAQACDDFELVNILYITYPPPSGSSSLREELQALGESIHHWAAWESAKCEAYVVDRVSQGLLPADDSFESKVKRMNYRIKVIDVLRTNAGAIWLSKRNECLEKGSETVKKSHLVATVHGQLKERYIQDNTVLRKFKPMLKAVGSIITSADPTVKQTFLFTHINYTYDRKKRVYSPELHVNWFRIATDETSGEHRDEDSVVVNFEFSDYKLDFDSSFWEMVQKEIPDEVLEEGYRIYGAKALHLA